MAAIANKINLDDKLGIARRRFDELYRRPLSSPGEQNLVSEALQELSTSIEELTVTAEELQQQNDELAAARGLVEAERRHFQELFERRMVIWSPISGESSRRLTPMRQIGTV